jgi:hypothetical protein
MVTPKKPKKPADTSAADPLLIEALARYRLLTIDQGHLLTRMSKETVGERLRVMKRRGLVELANQPRMIGKRVHWLTLKGAALATEYAAERGEAVAVTAPKNGYKAGASLNQRIAIVDCHISLHTWAEASGAAVEWFRVEFEANPSGLLAKSLRYSWREADGASTDYFPDAVGVTRLGNGSRLLFALEVETGGYENSVDNFRSKLVGRLAAFEARALEVGEQWPRGERRAGLFFVFSNDMMLNRALAILAKRPGPLPAFVFLNTVSNLLASFAEGWVRASGEKGNPFRS